MNIRTIKLGAVDSTNRLARAEIESGRLSAAGAAAFVAERQTGGVGRFGRMWASPAGGLWFTLAWPVRDDAAAVPDGLGLRVGVACVEFVRALLPDEARPRVKLKWPNDVMVDGRKVLGVLCEVVRRADTSQQWILVGVGLNANFEVAELPVELRATATTLHTALGLAVDLDPAAADLAARLGRVLGETGTNAETAAAARAILFGVGQPTRVSLPTGKKVEAVLIGLDRAGNPVFEQEGSRWVAPGGSVMT